MPETGRSPLRRFRRWLVWNLWPNQRLRWTFEGLVYFGFWCCLLLAGLLQQINLILLVAGLAAGPMIGSIFASAAMLRRLRITRRVPPYVFSGEPLAIDYILDNDRRWSAALALILNDDMVPVDRVVSGPSSVLLEAFFPRIAGQSRSRVRWQGVAPRRGKYRFKTFELATRSPFGLLERRVSIGDPAQLTVYPEIGHLSRRWQQIHREASETRRGTRHDLSTQQQEYHGLRDYRPGDSPRWIHWRTSARLGQPMVKEFEQQHEQDLAILIDPWLPRTKVSREQREALEDSIKFAATVCFETCRHPGRRMLLGWCGPTPGVRQGPASVKLLHELLDQLATLRPSPEASLSALLDVVPASTLRESFLIVVSTRPVNLLEEAEKSTRLSATSLRGLLGRVTLIDASKGDLANLIQFGKANRPSKARRGPSEDEGEGPSEPTDRAPVATEATSDGQKGLP
jgi:uncharacterized protein (DUF58 family)